MFGEEIKERVLLQVINADASEAEVTGQITSILNLILQHRNDKYFDIRDQITTKLHLKVSLEAA
jgi:hypothetical protein